MYTDVRMKLVDTFIQFSISTDIDAIFIDRNADGSVSLYIGPYNAGKLSNNVLYTTLITDAVYRQFMGMLLKSVLLSMCVLEVDNKTNEHKFKILSPPAELLAQYTDNDSWEWFELLNDGLIQKKNTDIYSYFSNKPLSVITIQHSITQQTLHTALLGMSMVIEELSYPNKDIRSLLAFIDSDNDVQVILT